MYEFFRNQQRLKLGILHCWVNDSDQRRSTSINFLLSGIQKYQLRLCFLLFHKHVFKLVHITGMSSKPKKPKTTSESVTSLPIHTQKNLVEWGENVVASNLEKGLLSLPVELVTEILDYFPTIGPYTAVNHGSVPLLPGIFLVRVDILRALSQVCIDYRRSFLPLLWESLNICFERRTKGLTNAFYKHLGDTLVRKCDGLSANPNLASYIG